MDLILRFFFVNSLSCKQKLQEPNLEEKNTGKVYGKNIRGIWFGKIMGKFIILQNIFVFFSSCIGNFFAKAKYGRCFVFWWSFLCDFSSQINPENWQYFITPSFLYKTWPPPWQWLLQRARKSKERYKEFCKHVFSFWLAKIVFVLSSVCVWPRAGSSQRLPFFCTQHWQRPRQG